MIFQPANLKALFTKSNTHQSSDINISSEKVFFSNNADNLDSLIITIIACTVQIFLVNMDIQFLFTREQNTSARKNT